jgi:hypothetical protein
MLLNSFTALLYSCDVASFERMILKSRSFASYIVVLGQLGKSHPAIIIVSISKLWYLILFLNYSPKLATSRISHYITINADFEISKVKYIELLIYNIKANINRSHKWFIYE